MTSPSYVVLNTRAHQHLALAANPGFSHASTSQLAAVVFGEIVAVASCMPVVLLNSGNGAPALTALLGLAEHSNLFAGEHWQGHVVPLSLQAAPFNYAIEGNQLLTLIDESSALWHASGQRLFASDGAPTPLLKQRQALLKELAAGAALNERFISCLSEHHLLRALTVKITSEDAQPSELTGMYTIDEARLAGLGGEVVKQLHDNGMLSAIHAMLLSLRQFNRLVQLARQRGQAVQSIQLS